MCSSSMNKKQIGADPCKDSIGKMDPGYKENIKTTTLRAALNHGIRSDKFWRKHAHCSALAHPGQFHSENEVVMDDKASPPFEVASMLSTGASMRRCFCSVSHGARRAPPLMALEYNSFVKLRCFDSAVELNDSFLVERSNNSSPAATEFDMRPRQKSPKGIALRPERGSGD